MLRRQPSKPQQDTGLKTEKPWAQLRQLPGGAQVADLLDLVASQPNFTQVDLVRLSNAARQASASPELMQELSNELASHGVAAAVHVSNQRGLTNNLLASHDLLSGTVRLGQVTSHTRNPRPYQNIHFGVSLDTLRTSMVIVGPPGSGKTRSFALPIMEHLELQALANNASIVAVDPKGSDFAIDGWFDYTIDPLNPSVGFSLYGGSDDADEVADRLASAMLPSDVSGDKAYFIDAGKNALYFVLAPFKEAFGRWPRVGELLELLSCEPKAVNRVRAQLGQRSKDAVRQFGSLLDRRVEQASQRVDPAQNLVECFSLLDRPKLTRLFDDIQPRFEMRQINQPIRVRFVLPESQMPDASRILARLITSQFVQVTSDPRTNKGIFKAFVCDESGPFVDSYVCRAVQKVRSNNAGLVLLAQSLTDFDEQLLPTLLGSVGCRALFGGSSPEDARIFSQIWGTEQRADVTTTMTKSSSQSHSWSSGTSTSYGPGDFGEIRTGRGESSGESRGETQSQSTGRSVRMVEADIWSPGELVNQIPPRHCILSLSSSSGERTPPLLVNLGD